MIARRLTVFVAIAVLAVASVGCADRNPQELFIEFNGALQQGQCVVQAGSRLNQVRAVGFMDLAVTNQYWMFPSFRNMLPNSEQATQLSIQDLHNENNFVSILGAKVRYDIGDVGLANQGLALPDSLFVFSSGYAEPDQESVTQIQAVPAIVGEILRQAGKLQQRFAAAQLVVHLTLEGRLQDGTVVHSNDFLYPITTCNGCLLYYPVVPQACCDPEEAGSVTQIPCLIGQDEPVDCRVCCVTAGSVAEAKKCM